MAVPAVAARLTLPLSGFSMRFRISHILITTAGIAALLSVALIALSPIIRLSRQVNAAHNRIINELDHASIRDAALNLLADPTEREIAFSDLPVSIAQTEPKYVHVTNGSLHIEYGGGFAHYGLIVDPRKRQNKNTDDPYYTEQALVDDVYFYDTE